VEKSGRREYGRAQLNLEDSTKGDVGSELSQDSRINCGCGTATVITCGRSPRDFRTIAHTENAIAAVEDAKRKIYAVEFHPEVNHTERGTDC